MNGLFVAFALSIAQLSSSEADVFFDGGVPVVADADLEATAAASRPAYLVVMAKDLDREGLKEYNAAVPLAYDLYGGTYLAVQGGPGILVAEGAFGYETVALSRWPSLDAIRAYWASPEFAEVKRLREGHGEFQVYAFEGIPPELPETPAN